MEKWIDAWAVFGASEEKPIFYTIETTEFRAWQAYARRFMSNVTEGQVNEVKAGAKHQGWTCRPIQIREKE